MCYIELEDTISINRKFVRITNPTVATYFAELLVILKEVKRKNNFDPATGMWKLDRKFVFSELGLDTDEQKKADQILFRLGVITKIDPANADRIAIDMKRYFEILTDDSLIPEDLLPKTVKMTATDQKAVKKAAIKKRLVNLFEETDERAIEAVTKLVDVYYDKGMCKNSQWEQIVTMLHACTSDPEGISEIVDYVIATNYVSIPAAIDSFMKKHAPTATKLNTKQTTCTGTMKDVEF